jgi:hypothetical protein
MDWATGVWEMRQKQQAAMREVEASRLARLARAAQADGREPSGHRPAQIGSWIAWVRRLRLRSAPRDSWLQAWPLVSSALRRRCA